MVNFAKAEAEYNDAIRCDEHCYEAYYELANLRTCTRETNHTRKIETLLDSGVRSRRGAAKLLYALAKEYADSNTVAGGFESEVPIFIVGMPRTGTTLLERILKYCGLEFEPECLRFYENKTPTTSRSARQVREAVYTSSVSGWKRYEKYVQPLVARFRANGIPIY